MCPKGLREKTYMDKRGQVRACLHGAALPGRGVILIYFNARRNNMDYLLSKEKS